MKPFAAKLAKLDWEPAADENPKRLEAVAKKIEARIARSRSRCSCEVLESHLNAASWRVSAGKGEARANIDRRQELWSSINCGQIPFVTPFLRSADRHGPTVGVW
jgi:hypothetical protein